MRTIGEQKNAIQNFYNALLTKFYDMLNSKITLKFIRIIHVQNALLTDFYTYLEMKLVDFDFELTVSGLYDACFNLLQL